MIQSLTHTVLNFLICVKVARPILLRLANGRLQHDKQIGSYTYCNKKCACVIDYLLLCGNDFNRIRPCLGNPCVETELAATEKSATDGD